MILDEIFEHGVSLQKTVWQKIGPKVSKKTISRIVATDIKSRSKIEIKDKPNES